MNLAHVRQLETVALAQLGRPIGTVQREDCFVAGAYHMDMSRPMIVRVNYNSQAVYAQDCRHHGSIAYNLSAWVYYRIRLGHRIYDSSTAGGVIQ